MTRPIMNKRPQKIKIVLLLIILITLGVVISIFVGYRNLMSQPRQLLDVLNSKVDVSLGKIKHTATRDGVTEWTLEAESAQLISAEKRVILEDLSIVYYRRNGQNVYLTAQKGMLHTESNDIEVTGKVVLISEPYELKTEKLNYMHKARKVVSTVPTRLISTKSYLDAGRMSFDLETNIAKFEGNVEGIFAEGIQL